MVNVSLIKRNWLIGKRIYEECLLGEDRAEYGANVIKKLSKNLQKNLAEVFHSVSGKLAGLLMWTHYRILLQVEDEKARVWYEKEALHETWSVRTLQRNISSQYYYHLLKSQQKENVTNEMENITKPYQNDKLEFIKNPMITEFLGFSSESTFTETDLETSLLSNIQKFLMELGKDYAFYCKTTTYPY